ncbi:MAG: carbon storage regulator CsrA [Thermodesulfobacteriota bacterium]
MLVLTRKVEESISIGNNVTVTVLGIRGGQVRIGIEAPRDTPVNRTEVVESIARQNEEASRAPRDLDQLKDTLAAGFRPEKT